MQLFKHNFKRALAFGLALLIYTSGSAQKDSVDLRAEITYQNKRYRVYNNWISAGAGPAFNNNVPRTQFSIVTNYNFHIKKQYFQSGILLSGDRFGSYNNAQLHLCYGRRKETPKYNLAGFLGLSYTTGVLYLDSSYNSNPFNTFGLYTEFQFTSKFKYDLGYGPSIFADINSKRFIMGIRFDLYFSGAYKGER